MIATLKNMRAPGMAWRRAPVLASAARVISYVVLVTGAAHAGGARDAHGRPPLRRRLLRRRPGRRADAVLHLSWLYFTGIHTVMVVAALAVISEIIPTLLAQAALQPLGRGGIAGRRRASWGRSPGCRTSTPVRWPRDSPSSPCSSRSCCLVPIGLIFVVWILTMWDGAVSTRAPLVPRDCGRASRSCSASPVSSRPRSIGVGLLLESTVAAQQDTILVITGFVLAMFAGLHYWLPKVTGRAVHEGPAKAALGSSSSSALTLRHCDVLRRARGPARRRLPLLRGRRRLDAQPDRLHRVLLPLHRNLHRAR